MAGKIKLVEGGYYLNRKGEVVGPMYRIPHRRRNPWRAPDRRLPSDDWEDNGSWSTFPTDKDLVEVSHSQLDLAHAEIPGVDIARILVEFRDEFRGVYPEYVLTTAVGPMQSLIGLAIRNGHLKLGDDVRK